MGEDIATIAGGRCLACGHVFAPPQDYGCERCGAHGDRLEACAFPASGRVVSAATVHVHRFPAPAAPFAIAEVALDAGPAIRVLTDGALAAGTRVTRGTDGDDGLPRFIRAEAA